MSVPGVVIHGALWEVRYRMSRNGQSVRVCGVGVGGGDLKTSLFV